MIRPHIQVQNTLTTSSKRFIRTYRSVIMDSMQNYLDTVRIKAIEEIIPSSDPQNRTNFRKMYRNQPSTPGKLTDRTGALIKMLRDLSQWTKRSRSRSMSGDAMQGKIITTSSGTLVDETFYGTLSAFIRSPTKYWVYRGGRRTVMPDKQQLFFRFMWETGIRGEKRPFLSTAADKLKYSTEAIVQAKLDHLEKLGVIQYI